MAVHAHRAGGTPKNLVMIHLESLSAPTLQRLGESLPAISGLLRRSLSFDRFFSSATSSIMATCDLFHGNTLELEGVTSFEGPRNRPARRQRHLMDLLREAGYRTVGVGSPPIWRDDFNDWELWGRGDPFLWVETRAELRRRAETTILGERPFALYLWDLSSHLSYHCEEKPEGLKGFARIDRGLGCLDETVGHLWTTLERAGRQDDTVVIAFGDHGDQLWTHGSYFGFCHAFEPYSDLIGAPLAIYDPGRAPGLVRSLASLVDLKPTLLGLLGLRCDSPPLPDQGVDLLAQRRAVAFSRSLFGGQEPNKALPKAYSATDADYHLMVSSSGLELYAHHLDPTNHNNLLSFFDLDEAGGLTFNDRGCTHSHLRHLLNAPQIEEITRRFSWLRAQLVGFVRARSAELAAGGFDPAGFLGVRERGFSWNVDHRLAPRGAEETREALRRFAAGEPPYEHLDGGGEDATSR